MAANHQRVEIENNASFATLFGTYTLQDTKTPIESEEACCALLNPTKRSAF
jgi:hypothetical protein